MPKEPTKRSDERPVSLVVTPMKPLELAEKRPGRPRKKQQPPLPDFGMDEFEQAWFTYLYDSFLDENPDLTNTDRAILVLVCLEFIKYNRLAKEEITSKTLVSQARQHPVTAFARLMDMLSVTRKQRQKTASPQDDENANFWKNLQNG